jgi:hypothetical protein
VAEIVNLRRVRKAKQRREDAETAEANRIRFGRTKAERERGEAEALLARRRIEGHRLDEPGEA